MVRSSAKLQKLLADRGIPQSTIIANLTIIEGNVRDVEKVGETITVPHAKDDGIARESGEVVDLIICGVGGVPVFKPNPFRPTLDDPTICHSGVTTILSALRAKNPSASASKPKPLLLAISTTGISDRAKDVPFAMIPLYHWLLPVPHKDKKNMEKQLQAEVAQSAERRAIRGFVIVRPSLLTSGKRLGKEKVRVGVESEDGKAAPAIGYTISREDVGNWIYEEIIADKEKRQGDWIDRMVTLTS